MRVCSGPGCLRAVPDGVRFCDECQPPQRPDDGIRRHQRITETTLAVADRDVYAFLYSSHRWQRLRNVFIRAHPFCARCERRIADIVDHIIPSGVAVVQAQRSGRWPGDKYAGFFFRSNLQGLCRSCHGFKTDEDKAHTGAWPDAVAIELTTTKHKWLA